MSNSKSLKSVKKMEPTSQQMEAIKNQIVAKSFDGAFQQELRSRTYPKPEILNETWQAGAYNTMRNTSPMALGITAAAFRELRMDIRHHQGPPTLNLEQFATINNAIQAQTPNNLDMPDEAYDALQEIADQGAVAWNEVATPLRKEVAEKIRNSINLKQQPDPGQIPTGRFGGVTGEA